MRTLTSELDEKASHSGAWNIWGLLGASEVVSRAMPPAVARCCWSQPSASWMDRAKFVNVEPDIDPWTRWAGPLLKFTEGPASAGARREAAARASRPSSTKAYMNDCSASNAHVLCRHAARHSLLGRGKGTISSGPSVKVSVSRYSDSALRAHCECRQGT